MKAWLALGMAFLGGCGAEGTGALPYVVRVAVGEATQDLVDPATWGANDGVLVFPEEIAPHAEIRIEFSERMALPLEVGGTPGLYWFEELHEVRWTDPIDGVVAREGTVLRGLSGGLEPAATYEIAFDGRGSPAIRDLGGKPLTIRFDGSPELRRHAWIDVRQFRTAPVRIDGLQVNGAFTVTGSMADEVAEVRVRVGSLAPVVAQRQASDRSTSQGVGLDDFRADVPLACGDVVIAEAFDATGASMGTDRLTNLDDCGS